MLILAPQKRIWKVVYIVEDYNTNSRPYASTSIQGKQRMATIRNGWPVLLVPIYVLAPL